MPKKLQYLLPILPACGGPGRAARRPSVRRHRLRCHGVSDMSAGTGGLVEEALTALCQTALEPNSEIGRSYCLRTRHERAFSCLQPYRFDAHNLNYSPKNTLRSSSLWSE